MKRILFMTAVVWLFATPLAHADTFGSGDNSFEIEFVRIGNPGNPPDDDPNPAGAVTYEYRIGKYEVSERMIDVANALGGLGITKDTRSPDKPATSITWFEAARFVNWLNTSTGHAPAYHFDGSGNFRFVWPPDDPGYDAHNGVRNKLAKYFLPSFDEWYKAAYYDPVAGHYWDYPTGSDAIPDGINFVGDPDFDAVFFDGAANPEPNDVTNVGLLSPYGTAGQGGNVSEWDELAIIGTTIPRMELRTLGGSWGDMHTELNAANTLIVTAPPSESNSIGFRIASVIPEPGTLLLLIAGLGAFWILPLTVRRI